MKKDVAILQAGQAEHTQILKALEHRYEGMSADIKAMKEDINYLKGGPKKLKEEVAILNASRLRQDKINELLAVKVVEHEADMKLLKEA